MTENAGDGDADPQDVGNAGDDAGTAAGDADGAAGDSGSADQLRERGTSSATTTYLLVGVDRRLLSGGLLLGLFLALLAAAAVAPNATVAIRTGDPIETLFQALVGATVTGVTLVLTLNQLVLSQELGAVGDQRERMEGAIAFREDVAGMLDDPTPPAEPSAFLRALVMAAADGADRLVAALEASPDGAVSAEARDAATELADSVTDNADGVREALDGAAFGTFGVVGAALDFEYSQKLYRARRLRAAHGDALPDDASDALDDLATTLRLFGPAREHFKTLYFQSELVALSRVVLGTALPSLVVGVAMLAFYEPGVGAVVIVCAATTVSLAPFVVLLAYMLRIATVTGRTLSIGPFVLRATEREEETGTDEEAAD